MNRIFRKYTNKFNIIERRLSNLKIISKCYFTSSYFQLISYHRNFLNRFENRMTISYILVQNSTHLLVITYLIKLYEGNAMRIFALYIYIENKNSLD